MEVLLILNINQVKTFVMVIEEGSLSNAAERLGLTQPAVSSHIHNLENYLGTALFIRSGPGRNFEITEAGKILYDKGKELIKFYETTENNILKDINSLKNFVSIGAGPIMADYILPHIMALYRKIHKKVDINITPTKTDLIIKGLTDHTFDIGFIGFPVNNNKVNIEEWIEDELSLIVPNEHKFAKVKEISAADILDQELIWYEKVTGIQMYAKREFEKIGLQLPMESCIEVTSTFQVITSVQAGLGIALISKSVSDRYVKTGMISSVKLKDLSLKRNLYIATPNFKHLPKIVQDFIDCAKEFQKKISETMKD